jgi:predicted 3-demethylubiquinone-9 3-methyltransferase (glyoxalase superfamily)
MKHITPCLWFVSEAEDAASFYTSIFPNAKITEVERYPDNVAEAAGQPKGMVMVVLFELNGQTFMALNGKSKQNPFTESISMMALCDDQDEIDRCGMRCAARAAADRRFSAAGSKTSTAWRGRSCRASGRNCLPGATRRARRGTWVR